MQDIDHIITHPLFKKATAALRADHDRFINEIITLTEIPAPPFAEHDRAAAYLKMLAASGLENVQQDTEGNVMGIRRGRGNGTIVAVAAHLDTVFPAGTDVTVRREGTKLFAPGIGDDTRGLAAILTLIRAMDTAGVQTESDILFIGDVGEEGRGDLRGIRHIFTAGEYREKISAFFSIDGSETQRLVTAAVGSNRYRVTFRGPGGHSFGAFGTVNPAWAVGDFLHGMARTKVPKSPKTTYSASVFGGGSSINAIPEAVWVDIDLRSESDTELSRIDSQMKKLALKAAKAENNRNDTETGTISVKIDQIGQRPAGATPAESRIVAASLAAIRAFGFSPETSASSTDANIPMSLGIPAVTFGNGGMSGRAHSLDEWIDVEPELSLRGLNAALAAIIGTAGFLTS